MSDVYNQSSSSMLRAICIPGSHDSGTYNITGIERNIARTQSDRVSKQLEAGARYFDLRFRKYAESIFAFHGPVKGASMSEIMGDIKNFIETNEQEVLIINLRIDGDEQEIYKRFHIYVYSKLASYQEFNINVTFQELWDRGKNIIIINDFGESYKYRNLWPSFTLFDPWSNRTNLNSLLAVLEVHAQRHYFFQFFVYQLIRTPFGTGGNGLDNFKDAFETIGALSSVRELSKSINVAQEVRRLWEIAKIAKKNPSIFMIDFINDRPDLLDECIRINQEILRPFS